MRRTTDPELRRVVVSDGAPTDVVGVDVGAMEHEAPRSVGNPVWMPFTPSASSLFISFEKLSHETS